MNKWHTHNPKLQEVEKRIIARLISCSSLDLEIDSVDDLLEDLSTGKLTTQEAVDAYGALAKSLSREIRSEMYVRAYGQASGRTPFKGTSL